MATVHPSRFRGEEGTNDSTLRSIELSRLVTGHHTARNAANAEIVFGQGDGLPSPVELLLAANAGCANAGCSSIDTDTVISRHAEPSTFRVAATGHQIVESEADGANRLDGLHLSFQLSFSDDGQTPVDGRQGDQGQGLDLALVQL